MDKKRIIGLIICALVMAIICVSVVYTPYEPDYMDGNARYEAPGANHLFGTDNLGRDVFSRTITALRTSFIVAFFSVGFALVVAIALGAVMGYFGGMFDKIFVRALDVIASIPSVLLALVVVSVMGVGKTSIFIALFIAFIPSLTRVVRAEFIREKNLDYVSNARLLGAGNCRIMFVHILPNTLKIIASSAIIGFNNAVLAESSLSYLSLGVAPPAASLGVMLSDAQSCLINAPWCAVFPGLFLVLMVLGPSLINESEEDINFLESKRCKKRTSDIKDEKQELDEVTQDNILVVNNLDIVFPDKEQSVKAVDGISFYVKKGEILGIVGESGSGKSVTALGIMGLLNNKAKAECDSIIFDGKDISNYTQKEFTKLRGNQIAMVFQEPMTAFNPLKTIGEQLEEMLVLHSEMDKKERKSSVITALEEVRIDNPDKVYEMYPHMLSGGMCQRALIAMAMLMKPKLLIADEPTTALDKQVALEILELLVSLNKKYSTSVLFISHDLFMIRQVCQDVLVMEKGLIVERAQVDKLFEQPKMDYTKKLINSYLGNIDYKQNKADYENNEVCVQAWDLSIGYKSKKGEKLLGQPIDVQIKYGQIYGICGPSGCGKSTFAKTICNIIKPVKGKLTVKEKVAMVFQNPYMSLTPWMKVGRILEEPLRIAGIKGEERTKIVEGIIEDVGMEKRHLKRKIKSLSGGQRQRIAIALALISKRKLIILDEPVSALDATVQKQIIALLIKLKKEYGLTFLLISHDEMVIDTMCDEKLMLG